MTTTAYQPVHLPLLDASLDEPIDNHTIVVCLPPTFYADHVDRCLPSGHVIHTTKNNLWVQVDKAAFADLVSDADYYSDPFVAADVLSCSPYLFGMLTSAKATLRRLRKVDAPEGWWPAHIAR